ADDANVSAARRPAVGDVDDVTFSVASGDPRRSVLLRDAVTGLLRAGEVGARRQRERATGSVVLIGGGPGAADLITVRGRKALLDADVVVFDRLAPLELLKDLDAGVELIDASKSPDNHVLTQDQINAVIVERARGGLRVARLKGGDPYVLGRGSEEVIACIEAGVAVEVIPGITSAIAGPSAAGIPVTHRGITAGFTVVSGHEIGDLEHVIKSRLTLVVLMGVKTLPQLVSEFFKHGASPSTPVAIVEKAFAPEQRTLRTTLAEVVADAQRMHISNPAIVVVGDVAALGADLKV
ncbi:MAG: uroporphyrinogen-III C-methyltransferase, partial [Actinomycetota bacterium]